MRAGEPEPKRGVGLSRRCESELRHESIAVDDRLDSRRGAHKTCAAYAAGLGKYRDQYGPWFCRHHHHAGLDHPGLFRRDQLERVAEVLLVFQSDGGDGAGDRCHDIGGVEPSTQTDFQQCHVNRPAAKPGQGDRRRRLEERGRLRQRPLGDEGVDPLLDFRSLLTEILLSDRSSTVRAAAAVALGKFPLLVQEGKLLPKDGDSIHDSLMAVLVDSEQPHEVRRRSLESVAPFNTSDIKSYVDWAYNSGDLKLKSSSIFAMGRTGETSWLPLLLKEIQSPDPDIRYESAHACGALGEEDAVPHLIGLLEDDDYLVQLASINALGQIGGPLAKKILLHCVQEGDASLEEAARAELENIEFSDDPMAFNSSV